MSILLALQLGCNKLDVKPKQSLVVPETLQDFQGLMDNASQLNLNHPGLGEAGADNFYLSDANYNADASIPFRNIYIWNKNPFSGVTLVSDWDGSYSRVFYCNVALDGLEKPGFNTSDNEYRNVKGQALFLRANAFYMLAQEFALPYSEASAGSDLGIPLRTNSDLNIPSKRSTVKETYDRIINDLTLAKAYLPNIPAYKTRPSKPAAYGLLARVYLSKGDYQNAFLNADSCLRLNGTLINYNTLSASSSFPFAIYNNEVLFHATMSNMASFLQSRLLIEPSLYSQYVSNDLRKTLFFKDNGNATFSFKGSYNGAGNPLFCGVAIDEVYLIRAECNARLGRISDAMADLNTLMSTRFKTGTYVNAVATTEDEALNKILPERRKELLFRGLRWTDLRRLNKDPRFATTLTRTVNGTQYTLPPNDKRYTLQIPDYVVSLSGIEQNP